MGIFINHASIDDLNQMCKNTLAEHLGMEFTEISKNSLSAKMPVDQKTKQPYGLLHGGASVALAETLGSVASSLCIDNKKQFCVGLEINANHIKSVKNGYVWGKTTPVHIGKKTHIWEIRLSNDRDELICVSRITVMILNIENNP